jgi:hypothetical protein
VALAHQQTHAVIDQHALKHRKALLVVATGDLHNIALEFVPESIGRDLLGNALVVKDAKLALIVDLDKLLASSGWVGNIELHQRR